MKSKAVVGPPTTSNIPATLTRCKPALSHLVEIEAEAEEVQHDAEPETLEEVTSSQTTNVQSQTEQDGQSHSEHCDIQSDEEVLRNQKESSTDNMRTRQLVLASFFEASPLQEFSLIRRLPEVPAGLSAEFFELSLDTTIAIPMKRATDLYRCDTSPTYVPEIQGLDAQTGALVLYRPKPQRHSPHHLLQAVEDLSEHPEPFKVSSIEEEYHIEDPTNISQTSAMLSVPTKRRTPWARQKKSQT